MHTNIANLTRMKTSEKAELSKYGTITNTTRMKTLIKAKLKKSDGQINIDKYRVSEYRIIQNIISEQNFTSIRIK